MKKVGILTFHGGRNYGAALQCYALKREMEKNGINIDVINFQKEKEYNASKGHIGKYLSKAYIARKIYSMLFIKSLKEKDMNFERFSREKLGMNIGNIIREDDIEKYCKEFKAIIFGSDQIWNMNPKIYDRSKVFFGDFKYEGAKIAYSASFGDNTEYAEENREYIKEKLLNFKKISVRENSGSEFLKKIGLDSKVTLDPTMLMSAELWEKEIEEKPIINGEYILYYSVNCRKNSWIVAKKLSEITGLKVINLVEHPKIIGSGFKNYYSAGPLEFLNIIKNAKYVVTNSFHGTIFSIIFEKSFIPVFEELNGKIKIEERKYTILKNLGLEEYMHTSNQPIDLKKIENIDYENVKIKLEKIIEESKKYLRDCIEENELRG